MTISSESSGSEPFQEELRRALATFERVLRSVSGTSPVPEDVLDEVAETADRIRTFLGSTNGHGLPRWLLRCEACGEECETFAVLKVHRVEQHGLPVSPPQIGD